MKRRPTWSCGVQPLVSTHTAKRRSVQAGAMLLASLGVCNHLGQQLQYMGDPYMMPPGFSPCPCCLSIFCQQGAANVTECRDAGVKLNGTESLCSCVFQAPTTDLTAVRPCNRSPPSTAMKIFTDTTTPESLFQAMENSRTSPAAATFGSQHRALWIQSPKMVANRSKSIIVSENNVAI